MPWRRSRSASYALISYATLVALGATLTLPGLAGFVLAIGMAIDANVLVFERAREEYAAAPAKGLRPALTTGFAKAWSAIIDSNVTTLLAGGAAVLPRVRPGARASASRWPSVCSPRWCRRCSSPGCWPTGRCADAS